MSHMPPAYQTTQQTQITQNALHSAENIFSTTQKQTSMAESKSRYLRIRLVNVSAQHSLQLESSKFYSGGFDKTPVEPVHTGQVSTFWVCNLKIAEGATGGAVWKVKSLGSGQVCGHIYLTFSVPLVGNIKAQVTHDTQLGFAMAKIDTMYERMNQVRTEILNAHVALLQEKTDMKHLAVVFKDAHQVWEETRSSTPLGMENRK